VGAPVIVVGAGMAGLLAARRLGEHGHPVIVVEQGPAPGGRLATRYLAGARLDHGAQFFTVRSPEFSALTDRWLSTGVAYEWCRGFDQPPAEPDGHPRYAGRSGMNGLARVAAAGLDVRLGHQVTAIAPNGAVVFSDGDTLHGSAIVLTPPVPRCLALLDAGATPVPRGDREALEAVAYEPTLAVLATLDRPSAVPPPGGVQLADGPFSFVADNHAKGISNVPAVTLHASGELSRERWGDPDDEILASLLDAGRRWLGRSAAIVGATVERWTHARPTVLHPDPYLVVDGPVPMVLAGDAFEQARVEGAARSGWAAADALLRQLA
jgi:predicted NAD/FAD-dependent oxidoreductase